MHSFWAPQLQMYITLEWPHLWLHSRVCVNGWTLLLCLQILWQGVWKKGVSYHKPLNWHFVGLVFFYEAANNYAYKEQSIKDTNIHILLPERIIFPAQRCFREKKHMTSLSYIMSLKLDVHPTRFLAGNQQQKLALSQHDVHCFPK